MSDRSRGNGAEPSGVSRDIMYSPHGATEPNEIEILAACFNGATDLPYSSSKEDNYAVFRRYRILLCSLITQRP